MIAALWHRWFDAREYRRALRIAEGNYSRTLVRVARLRTENEDLHRANARLAVLVAFCEQKHGPGSTSPEPGPGGRDE